MSKSRIFKKKLPFDLTRRQCIIALGNTGAGKSTLIEFLAQYGLANNIYSSVLLMRTLRYSAGDDFEWMPHPLRIGLDDNNIKRVYNWLDSRVMTLKNKGLSNDEIDQKLGHILIIMDDQVGNINQRMHEYRQMLASHRHLRVSFIIAVHQISNSTDTLFREISKIIFAFRSNNKDSWKKLFNNFGSGHEHEFNERFDQITKERHTCMTIHNDVYHDGENNYAYKSKLPNPNFVLKIGNENNQNRNINSQMGDSRGQLAQSSSYRLHNQTVQNMSTRNISTTQMLDNILSKAGYR